MSKINLGKKFDVVVIGGGPAGMMAAGTAGRNGSSVLLLEKNNTLGKKLLLTGNGRCNLTHAEFDNKEFIKSLGKKGKFLFSSLNVFGPEEVMEFFANLGVPIKIEAGGKVFPASNKADDVLRALEKYLKNNKVEVMMRADVLGFEIEEKNGQKKITGVHLKRGVIYADKFILTTGGASYPLTGSTGSGYAWARACGHTIVTPIPTLVPLKTEENWVKEAQGVSLKDARISLVQNNKKTFSQQGDLIFTHFGLSGPTILNLSRKMTELENQKENIFISIDLKPAMDKKALDIFLQKDFIKHANKNVINYLAETVPAKLAKALLRLANIPAEKKNNVITREERGKIVNLLKDLRLTVVGDTGFDQAMVTRGGVELKEVDPKTMQSKIVPNLYLAGEVLDLDGPTGGYNLQICWSTGHAAGTYCTKNKNEKKNKCQKY